MKSFKEYAENRDKMLAEDAPFGASLGSLKTATDRYGKAWNAQAGRNPEAFKRRILGNRARTKAFGVGNANSVFDMAKDPREVQSAATTMQQGINQLKKQAMMNLRNTEVDEE